MLSVKFLLAFSYSQTTFMLQPPCSCSASSASAPATSARHAERQPPSAWARAARHGSPQLLWGFPDHRGRVPPILRQLVSLRI